MHHRGRPLQPCYCSVRTILTTMDHLPRRQRFAQGPLVLPHTRNSSRRLAAVVQGQMLTPLVMSPQPVRSAVRPQGAQGSVMVAAACLMLSWQRIAGCPCAFR